MKGIHTMKISFLPTSRLGKRSIAFNLFFLFMIALYYILSIKLSILTSGFIINILGAVAVISSVIAFFTGAFAVLNKGERSVLVYLSILLGFFSFTLFISNLLGV